MRDPHDSPLPDSERLANARLIAAAPVLLAALELLLNVEGAALHGARLPGFVGLDVAYHFAAARAAIAAATESDEPPDPWEHEPLPAEYDDDPIDEPPPLPSESDRAEHAWSADRIHNR